MMKRILPLLLAALLLCGCSAPAQPVATDSPPVSYPADPTETAGLSFASQFDDETVIQLSDSGIDATGRNSTSVSISHDIIYYEDRNTYESGNPYGEGTDADKHSAAEAAGHTVVNITEPGAYRVTGSLSAGQIRVDLGEDAYEDAAAVVELILDDADITCTVAPAILFLNVYECDGNWDPDTAKPDVDTSAAGANLILEGTNTVNGAYVAKIFKDKDGEKKLWKQDGAIYSYMSMNVFGPGALILNAANEGLDTELHLTVNGGDITILSQNDGINTNEDGVSVTTVNGGNLRIVAGLGEEGDGIDSNGYLVVGGGTIVSAARPQSDSGLDSDKGSFIHGGIVIALGAAMDWAESDSDQVTMNLQFSQRQTGAVTVTDKTGNIVFTFDPAADPVLKDYNRGYQGMVISSPDFLVGETYEVCVGGAKMMYTSTDVMRGPGGFGGFGGGMRPEGQMPQGEMPTRPEGEVPTPPEGEMPSMPEGQEPPGGDRGKGGRGNRDDRGQMPAGEGNTIFYMQDKVNFFSGITAVQ